jgi:DNA-binding transcriptional regulator YdaS (Cro superfamily)
MHPIKEFCKTKQMKITAFAAPLSCGAEYISQIICGHRKGSPQLALEIQAMWGIPAHLMRPDIYPNKNKAGCKIAKQ